MSDAVPTARSDIDHVIFFNRRIEENAANALLALLRDNLSRGLTRPLINFASAGGVAKDGIWLSEALSEMPIEITGHATAEVASSAVAVFLSFTHRFISPSVYFVLHPTLMAGSAQMSAAQLRSLAEIAGAQDALIAHTLKKRTAIPTEILALSNRQEVPISDNQAVLWGFAHEIHQFQLPPGKEIFQV